MLSRLTGQHPEHGYFEFGPPKPEDVDGLVSGGESLSGSTELNLDRWEIRGNYLCRIHNQPRRKLFAPYSCDDKPPCDVECLEPSRTTITNGEENIGIRSESEDFWIGSREFDEKPTPYEWCGETRFDFVQPPPKP